MVLQASHQLRGSRVQSTPNHWLAGRRVDPVTYVAPKLGDVVRPLTFTAGHDDLPCQRVDPEVFFPVRHQAMTVEARELYADRVRIAKSVCLPCPVRRACAAHALTNGEAGVWGGTDDDDRRELRRRTA